MARITKALLAGIAAVGFTLPSAPRAQDKQAPPATAEPGEQTKPFVPPSASKSVEVGNYYLKKGKYHAALSRYQEAANTDPNYPPAYLGLGRVYEKIGLKQKALGAYQRYLDALPSEKQAEEAKQVHRAIGRLERALNKPGGKGRGDSSPPQAQGRAQ
jgi:tetratricopeptide (TPR) repeat protein